MKKATRIALAALLTGAVALGIGGSASATHREECVTVVDEEGYTIPGTASQHYSYVGGPIEGTPAPPPAEGWQANTEQEPPGHLNSTNAPDGGPYTGTGLHYASHGNSGLADWFYFDPGTPDEVVDPVTHEECEPIDHDEPTVEPTVGDEPRNDPDGDPKTFKAPKDLAFTGPIGAGTAAAAGAGLLGLGLGSLYWLRRKGA